MDLLQHLPTESRNPASARLDELSSVELVELMTAEDATIAAAVRSQKDRIAAAIEAVAGRLARGGRLIYLGAGTSGRLGVLDAVECPPTFQTNPDQIVGLIAGGPGAMFSAVEGAEDSEELGKSDLERLNLTPADAVFGLATSGRTPYVIGAVEYAKSVGALTLAFACNPGSPLEALADIAIVPVVGPEVLSGSTRLKAGTATKLVLNMVSTGAMVRLGKVYGNLMIDLKATNTKLVARANRIVRTLTGLDEAAAAEVLSACGGEVKTALVTRLAGMTPEEARERLRAHGGRMKEALVPLSPGGEGDQQQDKTSSSASTAAARTRSACWPTARPAKSSAAVRPGRRTSSPSACRRDWPPSTRASTARSPPRNGSVRPLPPPASDWPGWTARKGWT